MFYKKPNKPDSGPASGSLYEPRSVEIYGWTKRKMKRGKAYRYDSEGTRAVTAAIVSKWRFAYMSAGIKVDADVDDYCEHNKAEKNYRAKFHNPTVSVQPLQCGGGKLN